MVEVGSSPLHSADSGEPVLQVLSLDGGGLRGIFSAAMLAAWEEDFGAPIADHFDLIVGTSTGGIIALALGLGIAPAEILSDYVDHGGEIFPAARRACIAKLRQAIQPRYSPIALRRVLRDRFGDHKLGDSGIPLAIPSYDLGADHVHLFRTPHHKDLRRDWRVPVLDVALATSAAPTFLPSAQWESHRLIDGGVWANNPVLVGVAECLDRLGGDRNRIRILSVGTTTEIRERRNALDRGGWWSWRRDGLDVLLRGQSLAATNHARLITGRENVVRVDAPTPQGLHRLDLVSVRDLLVRAGAESRTRSPDLAGFFDHTPFPYKPFYTKEQQDGQ